MSLGVFWPDWVRKEEENEETSLNPKGNEVKYKDHWGVRRSVKHGEPSASNTSSTVSSKRSQNVACKSIPKGFGILGQS